MLAAMIFAAVAAVGAPAPPFLLDTLGGGTLTSAALAGHPTFINVFASWCDPCRAEIPTLLRLRREHPNVRFIFVDEQEPQSAVARFARAVGIPSPVGLDAGSFEAGYGAISIPESIVIDARGVVRAVHRGPLDSGDAERFIDAAAR